MSRSDLCSLSPHPFPIRAPRPHTKVAAPSMPPPEVCRRMNAQVRANTTLNRPTFDYAGHVASREYTTRSLDFGPLHFVGAALLDKGVAGLLPPTFFKPPSPPYPPHESYGIALTEGKEKGFGLFSLREFKVGNLIMVEHPLLVVPYLIGLPSPHEYIYTGLCEQLQPEAKRHLLGLSPNAHLGCARPGADDEYPGGLLEGIINTNAISVELNTPADIYAGANTELAVHRAIFPHGSRLNHSCSPNARWTWSKESFSFSLTTLRPILAGEEITISYMPSLLTYPYQKRQTYLQEMFGFTCCCSTCSRTSRSSSQRRRSDEARSWLHKFLGPGGRETWSKLPNRHRSRPNFEDWCFDPEAEDYTLIKHHLFTLSLIEQEGLQVLGALPHMEVLVMCYGALGEIGEFRYWVRRLRSEKRRFGVEGAEPGAHGDEGGESLFGRKTLGREEDLAFSLWLSNPLEFLAWGWRVGRKRRRVSESLPGEGSGRWRRNDFGVKRMCRR